MIKGKHQGTGNAYYAWEIGDDARSEVEEAIVSLVQQNVGMAVDDVLECGRLYFHADGERSFFDFAVSDADDVSVEIEVEDIVLCVDDKASAVAFLQRLIERVQSQ